MYLLHLTSLSGYKSKAFPFDCLYDDFSPEDLQVFSMADVKRAV